MKYFVVELVLVLFSFVFFVNSVILIVVGVVLYGEVVDVDLFGIYDLLFRSIVLVVGMVFVLVLLFLGVSVGIVCIIVG